MTGKTGNTVVLPGVGAVTLRRIPREVQKQMWFRTRRRGRKNRAPVDLPRLQALTLHYGIVSPSLTLRDAEELGNSKTFPLYDLNLLLTTIHRLSDMSSVDTEGAVTWDTAMSSATRHQLAPIRAMVDWAYVMKPMKQGSRGRAQRTSTNTRTRGSRRVTGSGSTSSGEDSDPSSTERTACKLCDRPLPPYKGGRRREYCRKEDHPECDRERARLRQEKSRKRLWPRVNLWDEVAQRSIPAHHGRDPNAWRQERVTLTGWEERSEARKAKAAITAVMEMTGCTVEGCADRFLDSGAHCIHTAAPTRGDAGAYLDPDGPVLSPVWKVAA